jgi:integrase
VAVAALLGCRRGELLCLTWVNVHLDDKMPWLVIERSMQRVKDQSLQPLRVKTEKSLRAVAICQRLAVSLRLHKDSPEAGRDWVFASPKLRDHPMSPEHLWTRLWGPIRDEAGLGRFRLHDFRHTLQTNAHLKGVISQAVSLPFFGWTKAETATRYMHVTRAAETLPMARALDEMLNQAATSSGSK